MESKLRHNIIFVALGRAKDNLSPTIVGSRQSMRYGSIQVG